MKDINATIIIDIEGKSEEEVFKGLEYTRRKNIKKALRSDLTIEEVNVEREYKKCYELYSKVIKNGGSDPFSYDVWREWAKKENWELFTIKKKDKTAGYYSIIKITPSYYGLDSSNFRPSQLGVRPRVFASDPKFHQFRINDFIYWNTILYGIKNKASFVDLGGYQIKPRGHLKEVNKFKERWGGKIFYYRLDYSVYTAIIRKLVRNLSVFWHINQLSKKFFKRKPLPFKSD